MKLSIIIPASGRQELLIRCLKSLDMQINIEYEVCVIDDGSGIDEKEIRKAVTVCYPLIWRSFAECRGRSAARNEGVKSTTGDIIVFLDSDMEAGKEFLGAHHKIHTENPGCVAIGKIIWPSGGSFLKYIGSRGVNKLRESDSVPPWYFVTGNSSIERKDLPSHEPFDETISGWGGEDLVLGLRLSNAGIKFLFASEAVSFHNFDGTLKNHLERTYNYGLESLPLLVERFNEVKKITRLDRLNSPVYRLMIKGIIFYPLFKFAEMFDKLPLPMFIFDYLTFAAYSRGWLGSLRK